MADFFFKKHGFGTNVMVLFHGFGEDHQLFDELIESITSEIPDVTCYAIDIYYHGDSVRADRVLTQEEWKKEFDHFLQIEGIDHFNLIGFSLGGRFALSTAMRFPKRTNLVVLIAPDGLSQSVWYQIANTTPGNLIFKYLMTHPKQFDSFLRFWKKAGLANKPMIKFVETTLSTDSQRMKVYRTWTYFHPIQFKLKHILNHFNQFEHSLYLILGDRDAIIPAKKVIHKLQPINTLQYKILPAKHHQMIAQSKNYIISVLKDRIL